MKMSRPSDADYSDVLQSMNRRYQPEQGVESTVRDIIHRVQHEGDAALCDYAAQFDKVTLSPDALRLSPEEIQEARAAVPQSVKEAIAATLHNIAYFSKNSLRKDWSAINAQGCEVGERFTPYRRVGIYIPGGKAPLVSTALMTGGFALAAGVPEIVAMTPCGPDGKVNPAVIVALVEAGATEIYRVGGAQSIAALALGTESIAPVEKIFGPGNRYVVEAKRQLVGAVAIDLLPGPSEIMVLADSSAYPSFIAADLLAQAEHGGDSVISFVSNSEELITQVEQEIATQAASLNRSSYLQEVLDKNTHVILVEDIQQGVSIANNFAPEHLSLFVEEDIEAEILDGIHSAGAIYVGNFSTVACGDFLAGPSHTLPTGGSGKSFSGIRADQFQRRTSIVRMNQAAAQRSLPFVQTFAEIEGLDAHGRSLEIRVEKEV